MTNRKSRTSESLRNLISVIGVANVLVGSFSSTHTGLQKLHDHETYDYLINLEKSYRLHSQLKATNDQKTTNTSTDSSAIFENIILDATSPLVKIIESNECSSITDLGAHMLSVSFIRPLGEYIYSIYTSKKLIVVNATANSTSLMFAFDKPYSGIIKIMLFEKVLGIEA